MAILGKQRIHFNKFVPWLIGALFIVPFNISLQSGSYKSFYQDVIVWLLMAVFAIAVSIDKKIIKNVPKITYFFFILAVYWSVQPLVVEMPYPGQAYLVALFFVLIAIFCWACQSFATFDQEKLLIYICWGVLLGVLVQGLVVALQLMGSANQLDWLIVDNGEVNGQFGQRNQLGHYLMWGIPAVVYLFSEKKISTSVAIATLLTLSFLLALVNSRTIVLYVLALVILTCVSLSMRQKNKRFAWLLLFSLLIVLIFQWLLPGVIGSLGINAESGLGRLVTHTNFTTRINEWQKAWEIFKEAPIFGVGWENYAYNSLLMDKIVVSDGTYHQGGYWTHCHNIVLQILAEMGIIGAIIIFGGVTWLLLPLFRYIEKPQNLLILSFLAISACHSMVEYPLWYSYFLVAVATFSSAACNTDENATSEIQLCSKKTNYIFMTSISGFIFVALFVLVWFQVILTAAMRENKYGNRLGSYHFFCMAELANHLPLFDFYADVGKIPNIKVTDTNFSDEDFKVIRKVSRYRPFAEVSLNVGLGLYRRNEIAGSQKWLSKVWHYYPRLVSLSMNRIYSVSPMFKGLEQPVYQACLRYRELNLYPNVFNAPCPPPPSETEQTDNTDKTDETEKTKTQE